MTMTFEQQIHQFISRHDLLRRDGFYVVALSGGADSVALLHVLRSLGYRVSAVHCNFRLRGAESDRDENFCVSLCAALQVTLHRVHFDTAAYAQLHKVSIEMAARELRYRYFEQLRRDIGADGICVAHHRDDQVETVLLNLVRGTGIVGLQGMRPRHGHILRPLLAVGRHEIVDYLGCQGQTFVTDSTNLETDAMRNKLRLDVIPLLEEINPAVRENIIRMTENLGEVERMADEAVGRALQGIRRADGSCDLQALMAQPSPLYVVWTIVEPMGFNRSQAVEMLGGREGRAEWKSGQWVAVRDRARLHFFRREAWEQELPMMRIPECGTYLYPFSPACLRSEGTEQGETRFRFVTETLRSMAEVDGSPRSATLDATKVKFPLVLRPVGEGDRFVPFGMNGSKLVSDFLTDRKVSLAERRAQLVLADADGRILWVVGHRIDGRVALHGEGPWQALVATC